jgi:hypothetical protein
MLFVSYLVYTPLFIPPPMPLQTECALQLQQPLRSSGGYNTVTPPHPVVYVVCERFSAAHMASLSAVHTYTVEQYAFAQASCMGTQQKACSAVWNM